MSHLLHIDSSVRHEGSISREVTATFAEGWRAAHPDGGYTYRDLAAEPVPHLDGAVVSAGFTPEDQRSAAQEAAVALRERLITELESASTVLLGVPMYNYSIPSTLKAWIDRIVIPRFMADPATGVGALTGKRVIVVNSRGGAYGPGTPRASFEYQESYLRALFTSLGLHHDLTFVNAEMTMADVNPALAEFKDFAAESLREAHRTVRELAGAGTSV